MEPKAPELLRARTLTNSAAEFVETRAGPEALSQVTDLFDISQQVAKSPEFIPEFDRFFPKGSVFECVYMSLQHCSLC